MKKLISLLLVCCMLAVMLPGIAVKSAAATPSVEDILNDYHAKAFEARVAGETGGASTYARGGKTLEQETVDTLTAAGYEAYNVTADNYDALEDSLQTDFSDMGLEPDGSYIIVISGGETQNNTNSRVAPLPEYDHVGDGSSGTYITYYNGVQYNLRYVTLTSAEESALSVNTKYDFSKIRNVEDYVEDILSTSLSYVIGRIPGVSEFCTIGSLMIDWLTNDPLTVTNPEDIELFAGTSWTREYIQVRNRSDTGWYTAMYVSYAVSKARCIGGYVYNPETNAPEFAGGVEKTMITYSAGYDKLSNYHTKAVEAYLINVQFCYCTGDIEFYFISEDGTVNFEGSDDPLFKHDEPLTSFIPMVEYD